MQAVQVVPALDELEDRTTGGLRQIEVLGHLADRPIPRRHNSTISALNSGVNDRRRRGIFFAVLSIMDILQGTSP
ncbi:hypothetical protein [Spongiactinospora gelatinilytica]|uniref:hypothetical protein n=1 Tax=Spongiactinospora gelatinilytica TaxID=2666298 RepID=UPI0013143C03|nr:hypothetical protein [Spongiactinospora gelatinilytica]